MKLRTKIFSAIAVSAILATSMSAQMQGKGMNYQKAKACDMKKGYSKKSKCGFMPLVQRLNLSEEQQTSIRNIMKESLYKKESKYSDFGVDDFDKSKYIKQMKNAKENQIKLQAETIEKVYALLSDKQKSQLRVLMDLKEEKMKKGCDFDKNCNGRR